MDGSTGAVNGPYSVSVPEFDSGAGAVQGWPLVTFLELGALPTAAGCARLHTRYVLAEWELQALVEDAELLVSELVTNATQASWLVEGRPPIALRLLANEERLIIEVWDRSSVEPLVGETDPSADRGRDLEIVVALSDRWGFRWVSYGLKVVWCEVGVRSFSLPRTGTRSGGDGLERVTARDRGDRSAVQGWQAAQ